jgi:hypothetical protein
MPQTGRSRVRFPMRSLNFSIVLIFPALESAQLLTEMSIMNLPGGKERLARKADNLNAICEPIVLKMWEPRRLTTLWASTACYRDSLFFFALYSIGSWVNRWMMNWKRFRTKLSWRNRILSRHLPGGTEENHENISQNMRCHGRDSNWVPPECKFRVLSLCHPVRDGNRP